MNIGIMGGTFDPIHFGHLILAENLREELDLDKVIFIPTGISPHKNNRCITESEFRFKMLEKAIEGNPFFEASRIEIEKNCFSYTYDTMKELKKIYDKDRIYFMTGADIVFNLENWKNSEWLFQNVDFVIATRAGYDNEAVQSKVEELSKNKNANILIKKIPLVDISSSEIRNRRLLGKSIKYLTPQTVCSLIEDNKLYLKSCKVEAD